MVSERTAEADELISVASRFLNEVKDLTPGKSLERRLNREYGPGSSYYDDLARLSKVGLNDGWLAEKEVDGPHYRRARLCDPSEDLRWFSITAVYMESEDVFRGDYHAHPYGEINMVIPIKGDKPELEGLDDFWQNAGWTCPHPGSHHFPSVRGGGLIALFFLPAGRISYQAKPGDPQTADPGLQA